MPYICIYSVNFFKQKFVLIEKKISKKNQRFIPKIIFIILQIVLIISKTTYFSSQNRILKKIQLHIQIQNLNMQYTYIALNFINPYIVHHHLKKLKKNNGPSQNYIHYPQIVLIIPKTINYSYPK